jgi:hypothetical protein
VDLNRPSLNGEGAWSLLMIYHAGGGAVDIDVNGRAAPDAS